MDSLFTLNPGSLNLADITILFNNHFSLALAPQAWPAINAAADLVEDIASQERTVYGINTGFGLLAHTKIALTELETLQHHLLLSHAAGVGELLPDEIVQLILLLKINSLARGYSGVRPAVLDILIKFYNAKLYPCIPAKGSVGACGDLAPLAHLSLPLIGEGKVRHQGNIMTAKEALTLINHPPLTLAPKEGLALINGTQVSTAIAMHYLIKAQTLLQAAITIGALSVDAATGSVAPFHPQIHVVRGQAGQIAVAEKLRVLLHGSEILAAHRNSTKVQDPYCLRCQPQVLGASWDSLQHAEHILTIEANAVSDNPLVFADEDLIISGGNFHAEPVAQIADLMAIAIAEIGALAERRIALLVDPHFNNGLPAFLVANPGVNSGFMAAHVTAAALASANKSLAHPYSVDSIPTSANQEDHVSMATYAAWRLKDMVENVQYILAIELLAASQAIELRRPLKSSPVLENLISTVRKQVPTWTEEHYIALDIEKAYQLVLQIS